MKWLVKQRETLTSCVVVQLYPAFQVQMLAEHFDEACLAGNRGFFIAQEKTAESLRFCSLKDFHGQSDCDKNTKVKFA